MDVGSGLPSGSFFLAISGVITSLYPVITSLYPVITPPLFCSDFSELCVPVALTPPLETTQSAQHSF
jgi:hypothetical protein